MWCDICVHHHRVLVVALPVEFRRPVPMLYRAEGTVDTKGREVDHLGALRPSPHGKRDDGDYQK